MIYLKPKNIFDVNKFVVYAYEKKEFKRPWQLLEGL